MFHFLSKLFSAAKPERGGPDRALVEAAIDRLVDGTDPRLRGFLNYRARLYDATERAVTHVVELVDSLPAPAEIGPAAFAGDPRLRAFFASPERIREVLQAAQSVRDAIHTPAVAASGQLFALLSMTMQERQALGMELRGDMVQRDVLQDVVNFSDYRIVCPSGDAAETLRQLQIRAFDYLVEQALKHVTNARQDRVELEYQRLLLQRKLEAMRAGNWGLGPMLTDPVAQGASHQQLEQEIAAIDADLAAKPDRPGNIEAHFEMINGVMADPGKWLSMREIDLQIDAMLVKRDGSGDGGLPPIRLTEVHSATGDRRVILLGKIPRDEIPEDGDGLDWAIRSLG